MSNPQDQPQIEAPMEPVLPMEDIQGIVVQGFLKPHQTLIRVKAV
jgi:hypothetical protein